MKRIPGILKAAQRRRQKPPGDRPRVASGLYAYGAPVTGFRAKRPPTPVELVASYRQVAFVCANINARAVASQPLKLYGVTAKGQARVKHFPTRPVPKATYRRLRENPAVAKRMRSADSVEEITEHPLLDTLDFVNPWMDRFQLMEVTSLYLDVVGTAYWKFATGPFGAPSEIWPLPAWMVQPVPDFVGTQVILNYVFTGAGGQTIFEPGDILYFRTLNLFDPYTQGYSPARAGYQYTEIQDKLQDYEESVLTNRARPDVAIEASENSGLAWSVEESLRLSFEFRQMFAQAQAGTPFVVPAGMKISPISWSPKDVGELAAADKARDSIALSFDVPPQLINGGEANRANLDAALLQHARFGVRPRCRKIEEALNSPGNFVDRWDERLFLAFDDPVPADAASDREDHKVYVGIPIKTVNEARVEEGLGPVDGGDEVLVPQGYVPLAHAMNPPDPMELAAARKPGLGEKPRADMEPGNDEDFAEGEDIESEDAAKAWQIDDDLSDGQLLSKVESVLGMVRGMMAP